jgi:hypothetical protein
MILQWLGRIRRDRRAGPDTDGTRDTSVRRAFQKQGTKKNVESEKKKFAKAIGWYSRRLIYPRVILAFPHIGIGRTPEILVRFLAVGSPAPICLFVAMFQELAA